jgi:hypothetical protein
MSSELLSNKKERETADKAMPTPNQALILRR